MLAKMSPPSIVLLSGNLPLLDGGQFMIAFRGSEKFSAVPVAKIGNASETRIEGTCCFIKKPLKADELLRAVEFGEGPCD